MPDATKKRCSKCGEKKPLESFSREKRGRYGRQSRCKSCAAAYAVERRIADPEAAKARRAIQYAKNPAKNHADHARWVAANPERTKVIDARHRAKNREAARLVAAAWRAANPERHRRNATAWATAHPDEVAEIKGRRRARKLDAYVAPVSRRAIYERDGGKCGICHKPVAFGAMHLDHIIPLARGGTHEPKNVQVAHQRCNNKKYATGPGQLRLLE